MNHDEVIIKLREPFHNKDVEWKIQVTTQDKARGMVVAYLDARAVQRRLDEVVGPFNWKNVYSLWHDNSQICGISIFNEERNEWVTKFDGAENSEIEPIKGGLSDSFKRSASSWGIGRYLYDMPSIWVEIEPRGKSYAIKQDQFTKLEAEYNTAVSKIFGNAPPQQTSSRFVRQTSSAQPHVKTNTESPPVTASDEFKIHSIKPSGKSSQALELVGSTGEIVTAYIKSGDDRLTTGSRLTGVQLERKESTQGAYTLISSYKMAA